MRLRIIGLLAVSAFVCLEGCGGRSSEQRHHDGTGDDDSDAGSIGTGGFSGTAGSAGTSGSSGTAGSAATAGSSGTGPTCGSTPAPVETVPFTLMGPRDGGGASGGDGGAGGAGSEPACVDVGGRKTCRGTARGALVDGERVFVFDDGSMLTWTGASNGGLSAPARTSVWIQYAEDPNRYCGFFCNYTSKAISILTSEGGETLYAGTNGVDETIDVASVFGAPTHLEASCSTASYPFDCYTVVDHRFDAVVETEPEQRVPYGVPTRVEVPGGTFDVVWKNVDAAAVYNPGCADGRTPFDGHDFAAVRVEN